MHDPDTYDNWKDTIFETYKNNELGIDLPEGFVPSATRWIVEDGKYIGTINVRKRINDALMVWGGSIGIIIRYGLRGKGYSKRAFAEYKKQKDLYEYVESNRMIHTIEKDNIAGIRMLKASYKHYEEEQYIAQINGVDSEVCRFIIDKDEEFSGRNMKKQQ